MGYSEVGVEADPSASLTDEKRSDSEGGRLRRVPVAMNKERRPSRRRGKGTGARR
ncbi:MAG: hypothetical protein J7L54_05650 [Elusimicrobia bacterium]|nr:hypothetical protein [Elusimicrobiota bacterium]